MLVVPASTGEFEAAFENSGQTKEHTLLVRSLGVTQMIIAVNKMDSVRRGFRNKKLKSCRSIGMRIDFSILETP